MRRDTQDTDTDAVPDPPCSRRMRHRGVAMVKRLGLTDTTHRDGQSHSVTPTRCHTGLPKRVTRDQRHAEQTKEHPSSRQPRSPPRDTQDRARHSGTQAASHATWQTYAPSARSAPASRARPHIPALPSHAWPQLSGATDAARPWASDRPCCHTKSARTARSGQHTPSLQIASRDP